MIDKTQELCTALMIYGIVGALTVLAGLALATLADLLFPLHK